MNFLSFSDNGTITLGTPSTCTATTANGVTSSSHTHAITGFELALGNPTVSGYVLSSTTAGVRSWVAAGSGSGTVTSVSAGNGMSFTTITSSGSVVLGTPSSCTNATTNAVTSSSHTHAITGLIPYTGANSNANLTTYTITAGNFILYSDRRMKFNIEDLLPEELDIKYKKYEFIAHPGDKRFGVMAQDLLVNYPELVTGNYEDGYSVKYIDLMIREIASLKEEIRKLKNGRT